MGARETAQSISDSVWAIAIQRIAAIATLPVLGLIASLAYHIYQSTASEQADATARVAQRVDKIEQRLDLSTLNDVALQTRITTVEANMATGLRSREQFQTMVNTKLDRMDINQLETAKAVAGIAATLEQMNKGH